MDMSETFKWMELESLMENVKCGIKVYVRYRYKKTDRENKIEAARFTLDMMKRIGDIDLVVYKTIFKWNEDIIKEMLRFLNDD